MRMQHAASGWRQGQLKLPDCGALMFLLTALLAGAESLAGQAILPLTSVSPGRFSLCDSDQFQAAGQLSLRQRACWYGSKLVSPGAAARAAFSSSIGQWRNVPYIKDQDGDEFAHRIAGYSIRRSARETGELFAGYFNGEDPRPHTSGETVFGKRVRSALLSVVRVRGEEGDRPALSPIAGSLASSLAGAAYYREHTGAARYALESSRHQL